MIGYFLFFFLYCCCYCSLFIYLFIYKAKNKWQNMDADMLKLPGCKQMKRLVLNWHFPSCTCNGFKMADQSTSRHEKSLGLLTTKFVSLLQDADDGVLDLKQVTMHADIYVCVFYRSINKSLSSVKRSMFMCRSSCNDLERTSMWSAANTFFFIF